MTGGAFKNSSNLLGRRREIEELKTEVSSISKTITETKASISELRSEVGKNRDNLDQLNKQQRETHIKKNTLDVTLKQADNKLKEIIDGYSNAVNEQAGIDAEISKVNSDKQQVSGSLNVLDSENEASRKRLRTLISCLKKRKRMRRQYHLSLRI